MMIIIIVIFKWLHFLSLCNTNILSKDLVLKCLSTKSCYETFAWKFTFKSITLHIAESIYLFIKHDWHLSTWNLSLLSLPSCLEKAKRRLPADNTSHIFYIKTYVSGIGFLEFTAQAHTEADLNIFLWISPWKCWLGMNGTDILMDASSYFH